MNDSSRPADPRMTSSVVVELPYHGEVRTDLPYREDSPVTMDIYYPEQRPGLLPAVVLVTGFPDPSYESMLGIKQKEVMWYVSWARLIAASGCIAVTYSNQDPAQDIITLLSHLHDKGPALGIDRTSIGIMSMSGNVSNGLRVLLSDFPIECAVFWYGFTMDIGDSKLVTDTSRAYGFATPANTDDAFPDTVPMLLVRAGKDKNPGLNEAMDRFVAEGLKRNAPLSLLNYPDGIHCFDILDKSEASMTAVRTALAFLRSHLFS